MAGQDCAVKRGRVFWAYLTQPQVNRWSATLMRGTARTASVLRLGINIAHHGAARRDNRHASMHRQPPAGAVGGGA